MDKILEHESKKQVPSSAPPKPRKLIDRTVRLFYFVLSVV